MTLLLFLRYFYHTHMTSITHIKHIYILLFHAAMSIVGEADTDVCFHPNSTIALEGSKGSMNSTKKAGADAGDKGAVGGDLVTEADISTTNTHTNNTNANSKNKHNMAASYLNTNGNEEGAVGGESFGQRAVVAAWMLVKER